MKQEDFSIVRWDLSRQRPIVESLFLKFVVPEEHVAVWLRYTITKTPTLGHGAVWAIVSDRHGNIATRRAFAIDDVLFSRTHPFLRIGEATISTGRATGSIESHGHKVQWDLGFETPSPFFRHLPMDVMYKSPFPEVKLVSPHVSTRFYGKVVVDGGVLDVNGAPGMTGHNWAGQKFPIEWVWIHCNTFEHEPDAVLEVAASRVAPWLPFVALGFLHVHDQEIVFNSPLSLLHNRLNKNEDMIEATLRHGQKRLKARLRRPRVAPVRLCYVAPDDQTGICSNSPWWHVQAALYDDKAFDKGPYLAIRSNTCTVEDMQLRPCFDTVLDDRLGGGDDHD